ncbi:MAG: hypothetical protein LH603_07790 [Pseudonocardia sp.]|nr:hypothetical protein [Pseudonocardia sp.]
MHSAVHAGLVGANGPSTGPSTDPARVAAGGRSAAPSTRPVHVGNLSPRRCSSRPLGAPRGGLRLHRVADSRVVRRPLEITGLDQLLDRHTGSGDAVGDTD